VSFSPIRRQLSSQVRSRNEADGGQPLRQADRDVLGNVEGTWKLTFRKLQPEFIGLVLEAVSFLDAHSDEFAFQFGGARNFGAGMADAWVLNPLYTEREVHRVFDRAKDATSRMETKDDVWRDQCRDEFVRALQARTAARDGDLPMPTSEEDTA
jgi:hypothetical protein